MILSRNAQVPYLACQLSVFCTLLQQVIFLRVPGFRGCARMAQYLYWFGQNVPTSSHRWLALLTPLMIKLVVGVTSSREREERLPDLLSRWKWSLKLQG
jgi:hypothetical protein